MGKEIRDTWEATEWDALYLDAVETVLMEGEGGLNVRTNQGVTSYAGLHLRIDLSRGFPLLTARKIPIRLFAAEMVWYLSGARDIAWLQQYTRVWDKFVEDNGQLSAAYGYRWRHAFERDQIADLRAQIEIDPTSRQMHVVTWDASRDGLLNQGSPGFKNVPCLPSFTVNVIGGRMNVAVEVRSNDMMLGCPHDVGGFALFAYLLAKAHGYGVGVMSYHVHHAHVYDQHLVGARELMKRTPAGFGNTIDLNPDSSWMDGAMSGDWERMNAVTEAVIEQLSEQYNPLPGVGKLVLYE